MTLICPSGGTSSPKVGIPDPIIYGAQFLEPILEKRGYGWAGLIAPLLGLTNYAATAFCGTDPPAVPTFTDADVGNILNLTDPLANQASWGKLKDLVANALWYEVCKCDTGIQPTTPALPAPQSLPNVGYSGALCTPLRAAQTKVLNLRSGSVNIGPPSGWDSPYFNDAAWAVGQTPYNTQFRNNQFVSGGFGTATATNQPLNCLGDPVAPWADTSLDHRSQFLVRWWFDLPASAEVNSLSVALTSGGGITGAWSTGIVSINGVVQTNAFNSVGWAGAVLKLRPGQRNLMAMWVNSGAGGSPSSDLWGTEGWVTVTIGQSASQTAGPNCCAAPASMTLLPQILDYVRLIQRQHVPFSYIPGATHSGLTGAGSLSIDGLIGLSITSTFPAQLGRVGTTPEHVFDAGYVTIGTADGLGRSMRLTHSPQLFLPIEGSATVVAYDLHPGVTISVQELHREA